MMSTRVILIISLSLSCYVFNTCHFDLKIVNRFYSPFWYRKVKMFDVFVIKSLGVDIYCIVSYVPYIKRMITDNMFVILRRMSKIRRLQRPSYKRCFVVTLFVENWRSAPSLSILNVPRLSVPSWTLDWKGSDFRRDLQVVKLTDSRHNSLWNSVPDCWTTMRQTSHSENKNFGISWRMFLPLERSCLGGSWSRTSS